MPKLLSKKSVQRRANYLDDHYVVWMLARLIKDAIASNHVIHNIALRDLFRAEGLWG